MLPIFIKSESVQKRMKKLQRYLNEMKEFMVEVLAEFLSIPPQFKDDLVKVFTEQISQSDQVALKVQESSPPKSLLSVNPEDEPIATHKQSFIRISIPRFFSESTDGPILYRINWDVPNTDHLGSATHRFKEFLGLHGSLRKRLLPAQLPPFPSKNYLHKLTRNESEGLEKRRSKLEWYMATVCNDPAYQCQELMEFLGCCLSVESLWEYENDYTQYALIGPAVWETVLEHDSYFQLFHFRICKYSDKTVEWSFSRRFNEFRKFSKCLNRRSGSPVLAQFSGELQTHEVLPKSVMPIASHAEMEERAALLTRFLQKVMKVQSIRKSYCFRCFVNEPDG